MSPSNPSERQLLIAGYILGNLDLEESLAFEQLMLEDPSLSQELAALQTTLESVYGEEETPPSDLRASVLAQADRYLSRLDTVGSAQVQSAIQSKPVQSKPAQSETPMPLANKAAWLLSGLLVAVSLYLGIENYLLRRTAQQRSEPVAEAVTEPASVYDLSALEDVAVPFQDSSAELVVGANQTSATLQTKGLPASSDGQVYVLWTVVAAGKPVTTDDKDAILTAVFKVDSAGRYTEEVVLPKIFQRPEWVRGVAITIEDANAPQKHESSPILISRF